MLMPSFFPAPAAADRSTSMQMSLPPSKASIGRTRTATWTLEEASLRLMDDDAGDNDDNDDDDSEGDSGLFSAVCEALLPLSSLAFFSFFGTWSPLMTALWGVLLSGFPMHLLKLELPILPFISTDQISIKHRASIAVCAGWRRRHLFIYFQKNDQLYRYKLLSYRTVTPYP